MTGVTPSAEAAHRARSLQSAPPAQPAQSAAIRRFLSLLSSEERKEYPLVTGVLDYFPDALTMIAHVSYKGNEKHNPGQPLHHARGKSSDHLDCIGRHLIQRDEIETDNIEHLANEAWRSLAALQERMEQKYNLSLPRGATAPGVELPHSNK